MGHETADSGVKGAMRTLDLLETFSREGRALSLTQLAKLLDVPVSSCHQLVGTLEARGYLYSFGRRKEIYPSGKILGVARALVAHDPWLRSATPLLRRLRDRTHESVILGKRQGTRAIYLAIEESREPVRFSADVGDRKPLHVSAIGKAMLAQLGATDLDETLAALAERYAQATPDFDPKAYAAELAKSRRRGWYAQRGGRDFGVLALSTSLSLAGDAFGIAVGGPYARVRKVQNAIVRELIEARDEIQALIEDPGGAKARGKPKERRSAPDARPPATAPRPAIGAVSFWRGARRCIWTT